MIIHSPIFSGSISQDPNNAYANLSGSFTGSFKGIGDFEGLVADSVEYANVNNKPTLVSGSSQISYPEISDIPSGIISSSTQIDALFNLDGIVSSSSQVQFNDVTNNPFSASAGSVTVSKSIIPTTSTLTLGTQANPFQDLYLSSASLYIDGTQVISSNTSELIITTDVNQSLKLVETGADTVQIQTENGDITLTSTGTGNIELDAPIQIVAGNKVLSSDGNAIVIGEDLSVEGNITVTGNVDGVDVAALKSSVDAILASSTADKDSFAEIVSLINSVDTTNDQAFAGFVTSSNAAQAVQDSRLSSLETATGSLNSDISTHIANTSNPHSVTKSQVGLGNVENTALSTWAGSSNITTLGTVTSGDVKAILPAGSISGSSQVFSNVSGDVTINSSGVSAIGSGVIVNADVNASAAIAYTKLNLQGSGIVSGSSQVLGGTGIVSGSSQIDYNSIANQPTIGNGTITINAGSGLDGGGSFTANQTGNSSITLTVADGVISGSSQVSGITNAQLVNSSVTLNGTSVSLGGTATIPNLVSGSSQISYSGIVGTPTIGNATVTIAAGSGLDGGGTFTTNQTGNSTITLTVADGVVSGSSQVTVQNTTGYSTISDHINNTSNPHSVTKAQVGLGNVTNESKATMFASPTFTGTPVAPTAPANTNSTQIATTAYVQQELTDLIGGANAAFDTLIEISASLSAGDSNLQGLVDGKLSKASNLSDLTNTAAALINLGLTATATELNYTDGVTSNIQTQLDNKQAAGYYNTTIGTNDDISYTGATVLADMYIVDGVITSHTSRALTLANLGYTGATNANYITNNNQLTNGAGYTTYTSNQATNTTSDVNFNTININATTASTSKTTGALIVDGGVGIAGALNVGGDVVAYASSDKRLKDNIKNIENPIEKVQALNGVTWEWNSNADELQQSLPNVGVIAQEVEEVLPQLVHNRDNGYKGVDYAKLTGLLIEAIKEQQKQIEELKSKLG